MNKNKSLLLITDALLFLVLIFLDQLTKHFAVLYLKNKASLKLIDGVFELHYLENTGAAFGMLQGQKLFFIMIAAVILVIIVYVLFKTPNNKKYTKLHVVLVMIAAGAVGNMLDRLRLDYVVDFLYFSLINFPIFNIADIYVTCAAVLLVIFLLFVYKESDLEFLSIRTKKFRDVK